MDFYADDNDLYVEMVRNSLKDAAGFADGTQMAAVSEEIDFMADAGRAQAEEFLKVANKLTNQGLNGQMTRHL